MRVVAWHDGLGMDIHAEREEVEHVIAVRISNFGDRPEHVMLIGIESPGGEPIADDRPKATKIVDGPAPERRELPPRGQIGAQFKVSDDAILEGFVGYAVLGTGERVYSAPAAREQDLGDIEAMVRDAIAGEDPDAGNR